MIGCFTSGQVCCTTLMRSDEVWVEKNIHYTFLTHLNSKYRLTQKNYQKLKNFTKETKQFKMLMLSCETLSVFVLTALSIKLNMRMSGFGGFRLVTFLLWFWPLRFNTHFSLAPHIQYIVAYAHIVMWRGLIILKMKCIVPCYSPLFSVIYMCLSYWFCVRKILLNSSCSILYGRWPAKKIGSQDCTSGHWEELILTIVWKLPNAPILTTQHAHALCRVLLLWSYTRSKTNYYKVIPIWSVFWLIFKVITK